MEFMKYIRSGRPVVFDGAMGTELQKFSLYTDDFLGTQGCNEALNVTRPDVVRAIHGRYIDAGADVVETNTFGAGVRKLEEYGLAQRMEEINTAAVHAAQQARDQAAVAHAVFVCGTLGPSGYLPSSSDETMSAISFDAIADSARRQAQALLNAGVDLLLIETSQDLLEVKAMIYGIHRAFEKTGTRVPLQVQVTLDAGGHMLLGSDIHAFLGAVGNMHPDIMGLNCSTGPQQMKPHIETLLQVSPFPVSMIPNAGMPENREGHAHYCMGPEEFARLMAPMVHELGVAVVGGCCGTTPAHIRSLTDALKGRGVARKEDSSTPVYMGTGISGLDLARAQRPFIIGERCNTQGSKKTKRLVLERNWNEVARLAQQQIEAGATLLDISTALSERNDEQETMVTAVRYLSERVTRPFCVDSTDPAVIEAAVKAYPGACLINSINCEHDCANARRVLTIAAKLGCAVIGLTIDDNGMAKTLEHKMACVQRLRDLVCDEFGMPERFLYIDPLIFTLATGEKESADAARVSFEALTRIKRDYPGIRVLMGVSNVSYGLMPAARRVLNNVVLHRAAQHGLDAAIFNPHHVDDVETYAQGHVSAADDLVFNRREDALDRFIALFQDVSSTEADGAAVDAQPQKDKPAETRLYERVLQRDPSGLEENIEECLASRPARQVLNEVLLPAMAEVGRRMDRGEMILPFVLQAAEVMKKAVGLLEPHMQAGEHTAIGTIVLATVYGDIHDIGKNLVASIIKNQGYNVVDLGKSVALDDIIEAAQTHKPDAIGLSALLITTSQQMAECVKKLAAHGLDIPVIIGGAAVNTSFAERIAVIDTNVHYTGGVYYAKDAFEALRVLEK
jgi:5-methyltetrahydrofolate--homocysteine methyltransferase